MGKKIGVLCGGSGSSKFVSAISGYADEYLDPKFVGNVGDNFWYHGLFVCPDLDILIYSLSGLLDSSKGWGVVGDTFLAKDSLSKSSGSLEWFSLGDKDLAVCLRRTELIQKGWKLSAIMGDLGQKLRSKYPVIPATDDPVQTFVRTAEGNLHLQEFWVKQSGKLLPIDVQYVGAGFAEPSRELAEALKGSVLICPANPVTSILPTLSLKGVRSSLSRTKVVAISPFVGDQPFSGPAAGLMRALNFPPNSLGVAKLYSDFLKIIFLDKNDNPQIRLAIRDMDIECIITNTRISTEADKKLISEELISTL